MQDLIKITGISQQQVAHYNPILFSLQPNQKPQITGSLIQKCFQSLIKQKMTGCVAYIIRKQKKYRSYERYQRYGKNHNVKLKQLNQRNCQIKTSRYQRNSFKPQCTSLDSNPQKNKSEVKSQVKRMNKTTFQYHRSSINNEKNQIKYSETPTKKQRRTLLNKPPKLIRSDFTSIMSLTGQNEEVSQRTQTLKSKQSARTKIKLQQTLPVVKNFGKDSLQKSQQVINSQLWKYLTLNMVKPQTVEIVKPQTKIKNTINSNDKNDKTDKNDKNGKNELNLTASSLIKQQKQKPIKFGNLTKQTLINYINSLPISFKRLINIVFNFLQVKIPLQFTYQIYINIIQNIIKLNYQIWNIIGFIFWDINKDGIINSRDIFNMFKQYHHFDQKQQNKINYSEKYIHHSSGNKIICQSKIQTINNLCNVQKAFKLFQKQLKKITNFLSQPLESDKFIPQDKKIVAHLQQVLITKPNLKFKQVAVVLGLRPLLKGMTKKQKQQFFPKNYSISGVSTYRQCFIAADHNEQTRDAKLKFEQLKNELKAKRKKRNEDNFNKIKNHQTLFKHISYTNLVQSQMGKNIKQIVANLLGYQIAC